MAATFSNSGRLLWVSAFLFFFSLFLTAYSARNRELANLGYRIADEVIQPFHVLQHGIFDFLRNVWAEYLDLRGVRQANVAMQERVQALESRNSALLEFEYENRTLRGLLEIRDTQKFSGLVAKVVGYDPSSWQRAIVVDKGAVDGLSPGLAVVSGSGLVGQVISVGRRSAKILLVTDPLSGVDALIQDNRARGIIEGNGTGACAWKFVLREEKVEIGDRVITSGLDGVYPRGLSIGVVTEVSGRADSMFHDLLVRPTVEMNKIESVFVVLNQQGEPK